MELKKMIGTMFISGFKGMTWDSAVECRELMDSYYIGGLIFRPDINIRKKYEFESLLKKIKNSSTGKNMFLCADEEGGKVHFFKKKYGYTVKSISAKKISDMNSDTLTQDYYTVLAEHFSDAGLNFNFAPVADLNVNTVNPVIGKLNRSYSDNPAIAKKYIALFNRAFARKNILTCVKHFPGHGSSEKDSHVSVTDISHSHKRNELEMFFSLRSEVDSIMAGHLIHKGIDPLYPASLSKNMLKNIIRKTWRYNGIIITDDLEMQAVQKKYTTEEIAYLAVSAGNDILLCGNAALTKKLYQAVYKMVKEEKIPISRIQDSYQRIKRIKRKYLIDT
jgi:beta-N-acetylhexosaminidase